MFEPLARAVAASPFVAYAIVFGSAARGTTHAFSDVDIALGTFRDPTLQELGTLRSALEGAAGTGIDLVLLDAAPPSLAYRVFRDGKAILVRDRRRLVEREARAVLEYLDFHPIEELCVRGVLRAAHGR